MRLFQLSAVRVGGVRLLLARHVSVNFGWSLEDRTELCRTGLTPTIYDLQPPPTIVDILPAFLQHRLNCPGEHKTQPQWCVEYNLSGSGLPVDCPAAITRYPPLQTAANDPCRPTE
jgi:hypothetical protein